LLNGDILRLNAARQPDKIAVVCGERRITYGDLDADANRFANALIAHGLVKGAAMAVMSRNVPEYMTAHFGNARTGALMVNLSPAYAADELNHILSYTAAKLIVVEAPFQDKIAAIGVQLPALEHVVVIGDAVTPDALSFDDFIRDHPATAPEMALAETDSYSMTFTGGTTGFPKGALVDHACRHVSAATVIIEHELENDDIIGMVTPLYHAAGLLIWMQAAVLAGATSVLLTGWGAEAFVAEAERTDMTAVMMVPVQLREVIDLPGLAPARLAKLVKIGCAGATTPPGLIADLARTLPHVRFTDHYGQSETGPLCILKPEDAVARAGTVGRVATGVELAIVDEAGHEVADSEVGEIVASGPFLFTGYYNDEAETAAYFKSGDGRGWTGDLATRDADGFITLVGRSKDMIVSGGVNIYPREIELVLERHAAVRDCTVFGIPDEKWGETLVAYVVTRDGETVSGDDLISFCTEHLARFKRPRLVRFVDDIPKTPSGKVQKAKLRQAFLEDHGID
jgi:acyl-CoA synthetase (AMP-forming)/AMP-acid ligase II